MKSSQKVMNLIFVLLAAAPLSGCTTRLSVPRDLVISQREEEPAAPTPSPTPTESPEPEATDCVALAGFYKMNYEDHFVTQDGCRAMKWVRKGPSLTRTIEVVADGLTRSEDFANGSEVGVRAYYEGQNLWLETRYIRSDGSGSLIRERFFRDKAPCGLTGPEDSLYLVHETYVDNNDHPTHCEMVAPL